MTLLREVRRPGGDDVVDLRIVDGMIAALGPDLPDDGTEEIRADGRWLVPGLWDAHVHLRQWAQNRTRLDLGGCTSAAEAAQRVSDHVATLVDPAAPVLGFGHRSALWSSPPSVAALDAVSGDRITVLVSGDAHQGWLNSAALRHFGLAPRQDALVENAWFAVMPATTSFAGAHLDDTSAVAAAVAEAASLGVVGLVDFELAPGWRDWPERVAVGIDQVRVRPAVYPDGLDEVIAAGLRTGDRLGPSGLVRMGPLKIISDGSLNTRTASCCEPYADDPHAYGVQNYRADELVDLLGRATAHGLEVAVHAIGDRAVQIALDAVATTGARGSLEHAQLVRAADVSRMSALGVRASVQPAHLLDDRDVTHRLWPDRADRCFPLASLRAAGVELALGSDAPVSPLDPWLAMAAAVHRSADDRDPWNPAEALSPAQALAASSDGRALRVGEPADLALLETDPLAAVEDSAEAADRLRRMRVAATLVAGRVTHRSL